MFHSSPPTHPEATGIAELCQLGAALIADELKGFLYPLMELIWTLLGILKLLNYFLKFTNRCLI